MNLFQRNGQPKNSREQKVAYWARRSERERILEILQDRREDLLSCTKKDNCQDLAGIVAVCIEDINASIS
jgi:hypothetical protein